VETGKVAARGGHLETLKWIVEEGVELTNEVACKAANGGCAQVMDWVLS
jgi:hypothetical protein